MLDAISLFKDQGTVDELGIGTVRDTFADLFFPGTGTVQTSAIFPFRPMDVSESRKKQNEFIDFRSQSTVTSELAQHSTESVSKAQPEMDGFTYLMNAMAAGIRTPLTQV
jgi:hypothetical protein